MPFSNRTSTQLAIHAKYRIKQGVLETMFPGIWMRELVHVQSSINKEMPILQSHGVRTVADIKKHRAIKMMQVIDRMARDLGVYDDYCDRWKKQYAMELEELRHRYRNKVAIRHKVNYAH